MSELRSDSASGTPDTGVSDASTRFKGYSWEWAQIPGTWTFNTGKGGYLELGTIRPYFDNNSVTFHASTVKRDLGCFMSLGEAKDAVHDAIPKDIAYVCELEAVTRELKIKHGILSASERPVDGVPTDEPGASRGDK